MLGPGALVLFARAGFRVRCDLQRIGCRFELRGPRGENRLLKSFDPCTVLLNAAPHIGHTYTTIAADAIKRIKTMEGFEIIGPSFVVTGGTEA